jgi:hypothetical protein
MVAGSCASAEDSGFYADLDLGQASYPYSTAVHLDGVMLSSTRVSMKSTFWGGTVGYRFTPYFGSEVGYVDLGKASVWVSDGSGTAGGEAAFASKGPTLALVGAVQIGNLEGFLRLGYLLAHASLSVARDDGPTKLNAALSAGSPAPFGGVGLRFALSEQWHVKVEFDRYDRIGNSATTGAVNMNVATVGVGCRF